MAYDNSTLTLTTVSTPDPFITRFNNHYLFTFTTGNRVEIWSSQSLVDIERTASKHVIWTPPPGGDASADLWAPELHALHGRWYVYFAAAHPAHGNKSHRMYVLGGPASSLAPWQGSWEFLGRLRNLPAQQWAIDGTAFELDGRLYFAYSGWPQTGVGAYADSDLVQQLFIVRLKDPTTAAPDTPPVAISRPDCPWEVTRDHVGDHGINEGPQFLSAPDGAWRGLVYSCAGSWTADYKMACLQYVDGMDPLDPRAWRKAAGPLLARPGRLFGPGHGSFLQLGDGGQVVAVYHATDRVTDGWQNRRARVQRVAFTERGPYMGTSFGARPPWEGGLVGKLIQKLGHRKHDVGGEEGLRALLEGKGVVEGGHQEL
ncbi:glycosyl hydrolase [Xylariaceae sp. FL0662B]|nr:glycosyl hydrolase [Xylariaceae sp. FL0662B]